jgi:hypothetical protein
MALRAADTVKSRLVPLLPSLFAGILMYESDITQFLKQLKAEKPQLEDEQRKGRSLLWDKAPIDLEERARANSSRVKQKAYVYGSE